MNYQEFKQKAEKKGYVKISEYPITKSYLLKSFEIWSDQYDNFMCVEILSNDGVILYKQSNNL